jgi:hypothetical protein
MIDIARKRAAGAGFLAAVLILAVAAISTPMLASDPSDSSPSVAAQPGQKRKLRHPTPTPTPMALPPEVKAKVPSYKPGPLPFHDGEQLVFQGTWIGIPAAQARIEFHKQKQKDPPRWLGEIWIETNKFADIFYKMRDYMKESVAQDTLQTSGVYLIQHEKSRFNTYDVKVDRSSKLVTVTKKNRKGITTEKEYIASDPWGPISGAMIALTQDFHPGKTYAFDVFSGSQRYVFAFVVDKREKIHLALGDFDAWRIVPDVWYVSDGSLRSEAHDTVLWVSADERRLPLRIETQTFIGAARADLIQIDGKGVARSAEK